MKKIFSITKIRHSKTNDTTHLSFKTYVSHNFRVHLGEHLFLEKIPLFQFRVIPWIVIAQRSNQASNNLNYAMLSRYTCVGNLEEAIIMKTFMVSLRVSSLNGDAIKQLDR